jgi:hypothetical protein
METDRQQNGETKRRTLAQRVALWIVIICGITAVVWRIIWPWTGTHTELVFLGIFTIGIACSLWLGLARRQK